jgi:hypothetical protein
LSITEEAQPVQLVLPVDFAPALDDVDVAAPVDDVGLAAPLDDVDLAAQIDDVAYTEVSIIFSFPFVKLTLFPLISYAHRSRQMWFGDHSMYAAQNIPWLLNQINWPELSKMLFV